MSDPDIVVVGSGHNGLIAAAYLAKAGNKVLVCERNSYFGGGVATQEIVAPGFKHDLHSATHVIIQANPLIRNDELGLMRKHGLKYVYPEAIFSTVFDDNTSLVTYNDLDRTCASIAKISPADAESYRRFAAKSRAMLPLMVSGMFAPPLPQGPFWALLDQSTEGRELMHAMQKSMLDLVREWFVHEKVMIHLIKFAAELLVAPDEKGTGAILFNMPGFVHEYPSGVPIGGSAALVESLMRCLASYDAEFRRDTEVRKIDVSGGRATGVTLASGERIRAKKAVIGQIHPWLLGDMVDGLDARVVEKARSTKTASFSIMAAHFALNAPPKFRGDSDAGNVALINFAPSRMEDMLRMFDAFRYGGLGDHAIMAAHVNSQFDPSRAPAGKAAMGVFGFGPWELKDGGSAAWESRKGHYAEWLLGHLRRHIANLEESDIVAWKFCSPLDMVQDSPTFQHGDVGGVGKYFFQIGGHRPTPDLAQYTVPGADGLYLAGTFMHPPGGVTGGGRATAMRIAKDFKIDFDKLVR